MAPDDPLAHGHCRPSGLLNSYSKGSRGEEYKDGDLVVRFPDCAGQRENACETQSQAFAEAWRRAFEAAYGV